MPRMASIEHAHAHAHVYPSFVRPARRGGGKERNLLVPSQRSCNIGKAFAPVSREIGKRCSGKVRGTLASTMALRTQREVPGEKILHLLKHKARPSRPSAQAHHLTGVVRHAVPVAVLVDTGEAARRVPPRRAVGQDEVTRMGHLWREAVWGWEKARTRQQGARGARE